LNFWYLCRVVIFVKLSMQVCELVKKVTILLSGTVTKVVRMAKASAFKDEGLIRAAAEKSVLGGINVSLYPSNT